MLSLCLCLSLSLYIYIYVHVCVYIQKMEKCFTYLKVRKQFLLTSLLKVKVVWKEGKSVGGDVAEMMKIWLI